MGAGGDRDVDLEAAGQGPQQLHFEAEADQCCHAAGGRGRMCEMRVSIDVKRG